MDEGSPICLQDERCTGAVPPMTVDDFFAEAKRLNLRILGTPEETRAALDAKDAEIQRLRRVWEDTRTQRDELLAHIAGKAPLPQWAADWLKA
jgi:hypothetical protein